MVKNEYTESFYDAIMGLATGETVELKLPSERDKKNLKIMVAYINFAHKYRYGVVTPNRKNPLTVWLKNNSPEDVMPLRCFRDWEQMGFGKVSADKGGEV